MLIEEARILVAGGLPVLMKQVVGALVERGNQVTTAKDLRGIDDELSRNRFDAMIIDEQHIDDRDGGLDALVAKNPSTLAVLLVPPEAGDEEEDARLNRGWAKVVRLPRDEQNLESDLLASLGRMMKIREAARTGTLTPLTAINQEFLLTLDLDALLNTIVVTAQREARCDRVSLMLVDGEEMKMRAAVGLPQDVLAEWKGQVGVGIAGYTAATGETVILQRGQEDQRFKQHLKDDHIKSAISLPLKVKGNVIGVLNITNFAGREQFQQSDVQFLSLLAGQAAVAIQNANLYNTLQTSYLHTIISLANALEARDQYLSGHSTSVMRNAVRIAQKMGLSPREIEDVRNASVLHDIGKIGIRDAILLKPGKLDDSEWLVIKQHPDMGSKIVAPVRHLARCVPLILNHHERWDGSGYPIGLAGTDIPLGARVIAVADTYDAMVSNRPYRKAFSHEEAIAEIKRVAGTQLDPDVVAAFVEVARDDREIDD
ncbi:MAG TPA: GAF domain-containing protein [bacterium]|nr:GAF domain-containing protein [bacterium]